MARRERERELWSLPFGAWKRWVRAVPEREGALVEGSRSSGGDCHQ
jgi:hypothetical protein